MPHIFISYRREDSPHAVRLVYDRLSQVFGPAAIVMDVVNAELGSDFVDQIDRDVANCVVLLAVIGPQWLQILNRRQNVADDFVRMEIESALQGEETVIPVTVDGAEVPSRDELPPTLRRLATAHGMPIRAGHDFDADIARLIEKLVALGMRRIGPGPWNPVKSARLQHIASIVAPLVENDAALSPSNYEVPFRSLLSDEIRNRTGITEKSDTSVTLGEVGSELYMMEMAAAFEAAFDKELGISLDSSVMSIYSDIFDD